MGVKLTVREGQLAVMVTEGGVVNGQVAEPVPALLGRRRSCTPADAA